MADETLACSSAPAGVLTCVASGIPRGFRGSWHCTDRPQLVYPGRGLMTIATREGSWVVPPTRACWLPAGEAHIVESSTGLDMYSVYCDRFSDLMPAGSCILPVHPLLREMIVALAAMPPDAPGGTFGEKVDHWLAGQFDAQELPPLEMPRVTSSRLRRIAAALRHDPADPRTLAQWADAMGISSRSLARAFAREAGMTFSEFRAQMRLHAAMEALGEGRAVTTVAMDLGFSSAASFIAMFRRATGRTPGRYFRAEQPGQR